MAEHIDFLDLLPQKIKASYTNFELLSTASYYKTFQATERKSEKIHFIRALDMNSTFVRTNYDDAATFFLQEVLHTYSSIKLKNEIIVQNFAIENGKIALITKSKITSCCFQILMLMNHGI